MNKSQRIRTEAFSNRNKYIKVNLERDVNFLEILSLKINQKNSYQFFNADYGVIVGRVIANGGVGIPNAKISIFIPIKEEDKLRAEIKALYPYETPRDKNGDGKRYNLLPRVAKEDPTTGEMKPKQPFGSFPTKEEILTNETLLEVYEKYYKYSTVTNSSGDYMLFGVPVGVQTVHMSVDITDIGRFSMTPSSLITNLGYSENLFTDNNSKIKPSEDLDDLPHIETQEISVEIIPYWGDTDNFEIGITRQDFRIRAELLNNFTVFGSNFTMSEDSRWNDLPDGGTFGDLYLYSPRGAVFENNNSPDSYRLGKVDEKILYVSPDVTDEDAKNYNFDPISDLILLDRSQYSRTVLNGMFAYSIPCNRKKIVTDEFGNDVVVSNDSNIGIFTEFYGTFLMEIPLSDSPVISWQKEGMTDERTYRSKLRIPQAYHTNTYDPDETPVEYLGKFKVFKGNEFYSVSQFIATEVGDGNQNVTSGSITLDRLTQVITNPEAGGMIATGEITFSSDISVFSGEWLNMCLYFSQYATTRDTDANANPATDEITPFAFFKSTFDNVISFHRPETNTQPIGAGLINSQGYIRADKHFTDFIHVPKADLIRMLAQNKGFRYIDLNVTEENNTRQTTIFEGINTSRTATINNVSEVFDFEEYKYPSNRGDNPYFYKGLGNADCVKLLRDINLI